jgi:hypothetical protein
MEMVNNNGARIMACGDVNSCTAQGNQLVKSQGASGSLLTTFYCCNPNAAPQCAPSNSCD